MSARNLPVRLTAEARRDYNDALLFTRRTWGASQKAAYRTALTRVLRELAAYPLLGRSRDELFPGCRNLNVEQHVIYYRTREREIVVIRILHVRREPAGEVREPAP